MTALYKLVIESAPGHDLIDLTDELSKVFLGGVAEDQSFKLCFAIHELMINAVEAVVKLGESSGEEQAAVTTITMTLRMVQDEVFVSISNQAGPQVVATLEEASRGSMESLFQEERGRGIMLAQMIADGLTFDQDASGRLTIELWKKGVNRGAGASHSI